MDEKELRYFVFLAEQKALRLNDEELYKLIKQLRTRIAKDRFYKRDNGVTLEGKTDEEKVDFIMNECRRGRLK